MENLSSFENTVLIAPVMTIKEPCIANAGIEMFVKREDLIHPEISGNKWRKLKYNLLEARRRNCTALLTFGGAYSNHIHASAAAGKAYSFKTIGIIRGEKPGLLNPTLQFAQDCGMALHFVSRTDYHDKNAILKKMDLPDSVYVIPEGGTNRLALRGCSEIIEDCPQKDKIDFWCMPCGTGGTLAGMAVALAPQQKAIGFSALKGNFLQTEVENLITDFCGKQLENWSVNTDYHFGGYAKFDNRLIEFINGFKAKHAIQLDPVYTGKMLFGIFDLIGKGFFPKGSAIMVIHTGGQQGIAGFNRRFGRMLDV